jgi:hypothetical protein
MSLECHQRKSELNEERLFQELFSERYGNEMEGVV